MLLQKFFEQTKYLEKLLEERKCEKENGKVEAIYTIFFSHT
jgi:hypothetical protein